MNTPTIMTQVVDLILGDDALGDRIDHRAGDRGLGGTEQLHGLPRALDRHLVADHRVRLGREVGGDHGEQVGVTFRLVDEGMGECLADRTALRSDQEVDVGDLVTFAYQSLAGCQRDGHEVSLLSPIVW